MIDMDNQLNQLVELLNFNLAQYPSVIEYLLSRYPVGVPQGVDINQIRDGYLGYVKHQIVSHDALYWQNYEEILVDILAVTGIQPGQLNKFLADTRPAEKHAHDFETIRKSLYETFRYPLTEHLYYAHLEEAIFRREFVAEAVSLIPYDEACVCDIGCGPGVTISTILKAKPNFQILGIDISLHCIKYAKKLLETKNLSARNEVRVREQHRSSSSKLLSADIRNLPFLDNTFDVVVGTEVFEHVPEPKIAFFEVARILKPEGYFIASIPVKMAIPTHLYIFSSEEEILLLFKEIGMEIIASGVKQFKSGIATFLLAQKEK